MEPLLRDVRLALRRLRMAPGFTIFAVASLALGIGVSTAVYSAVRTLLWMPIGIADASGLMVVANNGRSMSVMSWPDFQDFRASQSAGRAIAAGVRIHTALRAGTLSQTVLGEGVSGHYFNVMGLRPRLGRLLNASDESGAAAVAVVSQAFWRTRLGSDPRVVGRAVTIGGQPFEVVGVVEGTYRGLVPALGESLWVPITAAAATRGPSVSTLHSPPAAAAEPSAYGRVSDPAPLSRSSTRRPRSSAVD